jgi:hypothetical protein
MEVGETDLNNLLIEHSGKAISMNFIRYIWEQVRARARPSTSFQHLSDFPLLFD